MDRAALNCQDNPKNFKYTRMRSDRNEKIKNTSFPTIKTFQDSLESFQTILKIGSLKTFQTVECNFSLSGNNPDCPKIY